MKNEIIKLETPELKAIGKSKAEQIRNTFMPMAEMLSNFENRYRELMKIPIEDMTTELCEEYKRFRLDVSKVRIDTGKAKDKAKEYLKLEDKAIMGVHNILVYSVREMEDKARDRENYFLIQEQKRLEKLQAERAAKLSVYIEDAHERDLSGMDDDVWKALFNTKVQEHKDRFKAEKKAEKDRIAKEKADKAERKRIKKEVERLKIEAELKETRNTELRPYINFIRDYNKMLNMSEADYKKELSDIKKEQVRKAAEEEAKLKTEREAREKVEREERVKSQELQARLKAKEDAEKKAKDEAEAELQAKLNMGDYEKVASLIIDLEKLKSKYSFTSSVNKSMYKGVGELIEKTVIHIRQKNKS